MRKQFIDVYMLMEPNPSIKLKKEFDQAIKKWKMVWDKLKSAPPEETENYMQQLMKANQRIGEIKQKIMSKSGS